MVAIATQKFIYQIACSAREHHKMNKVAADKGKKAGSASKQLVLTMEDLTAGLQEVGVDVVKPAYFADSVDSGVEPALELPGSAVSSSAAS